MNKLFIFIASGFILLFSSCTSTQKNYNPNKLYGKVDLQNDYTLIKNVLEKKHPSLYWYNSKNSINFYFEKYYAEIADSMTEQQFTWHIIAPLINKIHCGHTSVSMSRDFEKWSANKKFTSFPYFLKIWNDTMAVTASLLQHDSIFKRGTIIKSINDVPANKLISTMLDYFPEDGYASNVNYIRLSANFPAAHRLIFGVSKTYKVEYVDSAGNTNTTIVDAFKPIRDTSKKEISKKKPVHDKKKTKEISLLRSFKIDSSGKFAVMHLNTFSNARLRSFFHKSFSELKRRQIPNLILDIRTNGGGDVSTSTLLTKYISRKPFKVADTLFSNIKTLHPYTRYFKGRFLNNIELFFLSRKKSDNKYHLTRYENKLFKPKRNNHFDGKLFVLINGPTFSASCVFANAIKGQDGITLLGEETGGGWYGNNGIMIPQFTLPITKIRIRMPLFRIVQYNHIDANKGKGIMPDIYVPTNYDALLKGYDKKMELVKEMILQSEKK